MLTKKDFIKVAEILNKNKMGNFPDGYKYFDLENTLKDFTRWFKYENPNFNEDKFKEAVLK